MTRIRDTWKKKRNIRLSPQNIPFMTDHLIQFIRINESFINQRDWRDRFQNKHYRVNQHSVSMRVELRLRRGLLEVHRSFSYAWNAGLGKLIDSVFNSLLFINMKYDILYG